MTFELQQKRSGTGIVLLLLLLDSSPSSAEPSFSSEPSPPSFSSVEPGVGRRSPSDDGGSSSRVVTSDISGYSHTDLQWYTRLKEMKVTKVLTSSDFRKGTFRIVKEGRYQLAEDIVFAPNAELADNNARFWPPLHSSDYPMGQFYLGFFAAITVETSNVWIDLNGFAITMRDDFYLRQRWFSIIELADRAFVANEGVASLKVQEGDKLLSHPSASNPSADGLGPSPRPGASSNTFGPRGGPLAAASKTLISGGTLGQSSHAGIHGNGNRDVVIEDVTVLDFEVAGVQFNGGDNVAVARCTIGPSKTSGVPSHKVSHAVFTSLYAHRYLPGGLFHLAAKGHKDLPITGGSRNPTLVGTIQLGDKPRGEEVSMQWLFDRLRYALNLYFDHTLGRTGTSDATEQGGEDDTAKYGVTTEDAIRFFGNPTGLSDGSAVYGLVFHRLGSAVEALGAQDEPFTGPEHENITVQDVTITGLRHHTVTVPALVFADGTRIQGPVRDVLEITDMVSNLVSPALGRYHGNLLSDAYLAFWKLSNVFYAAHVLDSSCGNFGSNLTSNYAGCDGTVVNGNLNGRDIIMLQKKYFGGVSMSSSFFAWATTPGATFATLLQRSPDVYKRRQERHYISCGGDTMFHVNKGAIGIRVEFISNVKLSNVKVRDIRNTADAGHWLCGEQYRIPKTMELVKPQQILLNGGDRGADVQGIALAKVDGVWLNNVSVSALQSLEGSTTGVGLVSDKNDRREQLRQRQQRTSSSVRKTWSQQVRLTKVAVHDLEAGAGRAVFPFSADLTTVSAGVANDMAALSALGGSTFASKKAVHNQVDPAKVSLRHTSSGITTSATAADGGSFIESSFIPAFSVPASTVLDKFNFSQAQMNAFVLEGLGFYESEYGIPLDGWRRVDEERTEQGASTHAAGWIHAHEEEIDYFDPDAWSWSERLVQSDNHGIVFFGVYRKPGQDFHTDVVCVKDRCEGPLAESPVFNYVNAIMFSSKYVANGVFGGPAGKAIYPEQILIHGAYLVESVPWSAFGLEPAASGRHDTMITYYGTCPIDFPGTRTITNQADPANNWVDVSVINCKLDGGPMLGKGWGVGTFMLEKAGGKYTLSIVDNQIFDDSPIASGLSEVARSRPTNNACEGGGKFVSPAVVLQIRVDGVVPSTAAHNGKEVWPLTKQYQYTHEAASKFFYEQTESVASEAQFRELWVKALAFFRDSMEIGTPVSATANKDLQNAIDAPSSVMLHNQLDLGGGSHIVPFVSNDLLNQRAYTLSGEAIPAEHLADGAISEGGIMLIVGRAGIHSAKFGYLMQGTVIKYGLFVVSGVGKYGNVEILFADRKPMIPDLNGHYSIDQDLWSTSHKDLTTGKAQGLVSNFEVGGPNFDSKGETSARGRGSQHNTRFTMQFGTFKEEVDSDSDLEETCNVPCTDELSFCSSWSFFCGTNKWVADNCKCACRNVHYGGEGGEGGDGDEGGDGGSDVDDEGGDRGENGEGGSDVDDEGGDRGENGEGGSNGEGGEGGDGGSNSSNGEGGSNGETDNAADGTTPIRTTSVTTTSTPTTTTTTTTTSTATITASTTTTSTSTTPTPASPSTSTTSPSARIATPTSTSPSTPAAIPVSTARGPAEVARCTRFRLTARLKPTSMTKDNVYKIAPTLSRATPQDCASACANNEACWGFSHKANSKKCHLWRVQPKSGFKKQKSWTFGTPNC